MTLKDKIAIVTGGGSGFGEGIVRTFVEQGARVVVADRNGEAAERVAASLGDSAVSVVSDVTTLEGVQAAFEKAIATWGDLDILVNNAGIGQRPVPLEDIDLETFDTLLAVNVRSIYLGARVMVPHFKAKGGGVILNMASTAAVRPRPNLTWYNATKGWVVTATRSMAIELASSQIRVNAINPVAGATPMLSTFIKEDTQEQRDGMIATIPLGRLSTPQDMGSAAAFLCSDAAAMITGVALEVDGGRCI